MTIYVAMGLGSGESETAKTRWDTVSRIAGVYRLTGVV